MQFRIRDILVLGTIVLFASPVFGQHNDPHVQRGGRAFMNNPEVLSPPILRRPIYACAQTVVVNGYIPNAKIQIFAAGNPTPIASAVATEGPSQIIQISAPFTLGQVITAVQTFDGVDSKPSNAVTATSHKSDFPDGLPQPRLAQVPCYECGRALEVADVIPGAWWKAFAEDSIESGMFSVPIEVAASSGSAYTFVNAPLKKGQRITVQSGICSDKSAISRPANVQPQPAATAPPSHPTPKTRVQRCSQPPPAKIRQPLPGDSMVDIFDFVPGSRITVYAGAEKIGDGSGSKITLTRRIRDRDKVAVVQSIGSCVGELIYVITAGCSERDNKACSSEWPAFRHSGLRDGQQPFDSPLADPEKVKTIKVKRQFSPSPLQSFRASAIVHNGRVYIGNANGRLYALDPTTLLPHWQYPEPGEPPLLSDYAIKITRHNPSSEGLAASAAIGTVMGKDAVIFGAPDKSIPPGHGSGRLFALDAATGAVRWKSPEIARLSGLTEDSTAELQENIGYSSPLVLEDRTFVGIANHADSPIQNGRVVAVDTNRGDIVPTFSFRSTSTRGGGIWSSLAGGLDKDAIYATTGNARAWHGGATQPQPRVDHSLSLLRLNAKTGGLEWKLKPVPFNLDHDPDWASGPTLLTARCGNTVASTQKDGWSYAVSSGRGPGGVPQLRWQFPPTGIPFKTGTHGDTRYLIPGAAWNDTFITTTGGHIIEAGQIRPGLGRLHALDVCNPSNPVRWIADNIPGRRESEPSQLGPPTVTRGIVFVGTNKGHLVVLADPSVWPADGSVCDHPEVSNADCVSNGFTLVPRPKILADIDLDPHDHDDAIFTEPILASGRVFVATRAGKLYMLETDD
jgi:outer membrane protein assembly factor BamB